MAAKVEIDFEARGEQRVVSAYEAWENAIRRTNRRLVESEATTQQQNAALRRLRQEQRSEVEAQKEAAKTRRAGMTAQQQYLEGSKRLQQQLNAGRLSEDEYRTAREQLRRSTIGLTQAERDQQAAAAKQQADQQAGEVIVRRNATAVERYREQLRELRRLHQAGAIDARTLSRERSRLRTETERATGAEDRRNRELREAEQVINATRTADERYEAELRRLRTLLQQGRIDQETFNRAVGQARGNLLGATTANNSLIGSLGRTALAVTGVGSAVGGVLLIARKLRQEYDNLLERQGKAADTQEFIDRAVLAASKNTIGLMTPAELRAEASAINEQTDVPIGSAAQIIGSAVTSTGVQNEQELELAKQSARAAAAYAPEADVETQSAIAGVGASLAKRLDVTPEEAIGFMGKVGLQSNVADLQSQVQNLAPALLSLVASGMDAQSAASLITAMTQEGDFTGETTATAVQNVVGELRDRFGKRFTDDRGNFDARAALELIRTDDEARQLFLKGGEIDGQKFGEAALGRAKSRMAFERLVTPGTMAYQQFASDRGNVDTVQAGGDLYRDVVRRNRDTARVFNMRRAFTGAAERLQANDPQAIVAEVRKGMAKVEQAAGDSAIAQQLAGVRREILANAGTGKDPRAFARVAIADLRREVDDLRDGVASETITTRDRYGGVSQMTRPGRPANERELQVAEQLSRLADKLQQLIDTPAPAPPRVVVDLKPQQQTRQPVEPELTIPDRLQPGTEPQPAPPRVVVDLKPQQQTRQPVEPELTIPDRLQPGTEPQPAPPATEAATLPSPVTPPANAPEVERTTAETPPSATVDGLGEVTSLLQKQLDQSQRMNAALLSELQTGRRDQSTAVTQQRQAMDRLLSQLPARTAPLPFAAPSTEPPRAAMLGRV